jgi:hypothetical protein
MLVVGLSDSTPTMLEILDGGGAHRHPSGFQMAKSAPWAIRVE